DDCESTLPRPRNSSVPPRRPFKTRGSSPQGGPVRSRLETLVWRWRRCLGVGRADPEGSRRLIQAAAEAGADVTRGVPLPADQVEVRRRNALELDLGRHLHTGYHGPRWTTGEVALLGTLPDEEVAARVGKTPSAVRQKREELGIINPAVNCWTAEDLALL